MKIYINSKYLVIGLGKKSGTRTSSFGVSKRESHDSSDFYSRRIYEDLKEERGDSIENVIDENILDSIQRLDSRDMSVLPNECVHLMVTSPPYNVGKEYDEDLNLREYRSLLKDVFSEVYRVLVVGGRACINIANLGRRPYIPLHSYLIQDLENLGFLMRGEIIWFKAASAGHGNNSNRHRPRCPLFMFLCTHISHPKLFTVV